jgi:hypothetical protein
MLHGPLLRKDRGLLRQHVLSLRPDVHQWKVLSLSPVLLGDVLSLGPDVRQGKLLSLSPVLLGDVLSLRPDVLQ